jgi:hypothetical protein
MSEPRGGEPMTRAEREELLRLLRAHERMAKSDVDARRAALLADFEEQVAAIYKSNDDRWATITEAAQRAVAEADQAIAAACTEAGIRPEFRPRLELMWYGRGENAVAARRGELRKVASTRLDAAAKRAKTEIERAALSLRTDLATRALVTAEAQDWLARMPTLESLLPPLQLEEIEEENRGATKRDRERFGMLGRAIEQTRDDKS